MNRETRPVIVSPRFGALVNASVLGGLIALFLWWLLSLAGSLVWSILNTPIQPR